MNQRQSRLTDEEWLRADEPGPPLRALFQQRRGLLLGAVVLTLLLAVVVAAERPATSSAKPAPDAPSSASGVPFFGLFPVFAYDGGHRQVLLLNFRAETWLWSNHQWVLAHPTVAPPRRTGAAVAWDPDMKAVLLFGGQAPGNEPLLHDTWVWDGASWRDAGSGRLAPPPSLISTMAYDGPRHEMLLVESDIRFGAPIQLWAWDGIKWHQRSVAGGPSSPVAAIGVEPRTQTMIAIAGDCTGFQCRSRTWRWDGRNWHQLSPAHQPSFAYYSMALAPDPISGRLLLVTVSRDPLGPAHAETWSWDGRDWAGLQMTGQPGPDVKIVAAQGDNVAGAIFGFEDVSRDFNALRINAWEWTGSAWRAISP